MIIMRRGRRSRRSSSSISSRSKSSTSKSGGCNSRLLTQLINEDGKNMI